MGCLLGLSRQGRLDHGVQPHPFVGHGHRRHARRAGGADTPAAHADAGPRRRSRQRLSPALQQRIRRARLLPRPARIGRTGGADRDAALRRPPLSLRRRAGPYPDRPRACDHRRLGQRHPGRGRASDARGRRHADREPPGQSLGQGAAHPFRDAALAPSGSRAILRRWRCGRARRHHGDRGQQAEGRAVLRQCGRRADRDPDGPVCGRPAGRARCAGRRGARLEFRSCCRLGAWRMGRSDGPCPRFRRNRRPAHDHGERAVPHDARAHALHRSRRPLYRARPAGAPRARGRGGVQHLFAVGYLSRAASAAHAGRARSCRAADAGPRAADRREPLWPAGLAAAGGGDRDDDRLARGVGTCRGACQGDRRRSGAGLAEHPPPRLRSRFRGRRQHAGPRRLYRPGLCRRRPDLGVGQPDPGICL